MIGDRFRMKWGEYVTLVTEFDSDGRAKARVDETGDVISVQYAQVDETWSGNE